jgi:hypothetical protein
MWYETAGAEVKNLLYLLLIVFLGCGTPPLMSPGATLLLSLDHYRREMRQLEKEPQRWPERQVLAEWLKTQYGTTIGKSAQFEQLVDTASKRREFLIVLQDHPNLRSERVAEMKEEVAKMNKELEELKRPVTAQVENVEMRVPRDRSQSIEAIAAIGLAALGIEVLVTGVSRLSAPPTTVVGERYSVTDNGPFATVRTPEGQVYRCSLFHIDEDVASVRCDPPGGGS